MITTVTLNTSIDKAYYMGKKVKNGTVMRVKTCVNSAGGKGLNVARIIHLCGSKVLATGFVGGNNGRYLEELLDIDGIPYQFTHVNSETRSCINVLDEEYGSTEYLESGCEVTESDKLRFMENFSEIIENSNILTISGSIPKGVEPEIYADLIALSKKLGKKVILDTSGRALELGIKAQPTVVKPNQDEIENLFKTKISSIDDMIYFAEKIYEFNIPFVLVSLGGDGALLVCEEGVYHGMPPKVKVMNTVGCGDSMVGAFAVAFEKNETPENCLKYAIAVATANTQSLKTGDFSTETCQEIFEQVTIKKL